MGIRKPEGTTVVVTGGNAGLGYECAKAIAGSGRDLRAVLAVRDTEKGAAAARVISKETDNPNVETMRLDLASLASVRSFAEELARRGDLPPLRALVCNAGLQVVSGTRYTEDGFETAFGVNHLGHFLLANLLLLQLVPPARIVFVSSAAHDPGRRTGMPVPRYRDAEDLAYPERHHNSEGAGEGQGTVGRRRYTTSKLCNVVCAYELDRRLRAEGLSTPQAPIAVDAFDPGGMASTGFTRDYPPLARLAWDRLLPPLVPLLRRLGIGMSTAEASGESLARLATAPTLRGASGRYFEVGGEARSSEESHDRGKAAELWEGSARLVGLRDEETPLRVEKVAPEGR